MAISRCRNLLVARVMPPRDRDTPNATALPRLLDTHRHRDSRRVVFGRCRNLAVTLAHERNRQKNPAA